MEMITTILFFTMGDFLILSNKHKEGYVILMHQTLLWQYNYSNLTKCIRKYMNKDDKIQYKNINYFAVILNRDVSKMKTLMINSIIINSN